MFRSCVAAWFFSNSYCQTVLVGLYESPEKPNNALDYLRQNMTTEGPETADVEALKTEVTDLRRENERLQEEINDLKARVSPLQLISKEIYDVPARSAERLKLL
mgnify:CR=1 FL=1